MENTSYNLIDRTYEDWDPPINHIEHKIKLLLVMQGYKRSDIHFRGEVTSRYLRYGYWREIQPNDLDYVSVHSGIEIEICELYDDDCGLLLSYEIKGGMRNNDTKNKSKENVQ